MRHLSSPLIRYGLMVLIAFLIAIKTAEFAGVSPLVTKQRLIDFDAFHLVGHMFWHGDVHQVYNFDAFQTQKAPGNGLSGSLVWAYPPQFTLLVAPMALLPVWLAYFAFVSTTLVAFLFVVLRLAGKLTTPVLVATFPALMVNIASGQNGFLTGALIGFVAIGFLRPKSAAGVPLGLMIIKPHLAAGLGIYAVAMRSWRTLTVAAIIVGISAALTTIALGPEVWTAFLNGAAEAAGFLEAGHYPLHRMVSIYAAVLSFGYSATEAMAVHTVVAVLLLAMVCLAIHRSLPRRQVLALATLTSILVSPYAYDYDLSMFGIAVALLAPDLLRLTSGREQAALLGLSWIACSWGLLQTRLEGASLAGIALLAFTVAVWRLLQREPAWIASGHHEQIGCEHKSAAAIESGRA